MPGTQLYSGCIRSALASTDRAEPGPAATARLNVKEARATAADVLGTEGRVGASQEAVGGAFVFEYLTFPGAERARELQGALVTVTLVDAEHARVQVAGVTVAARAPIARARDCFVVGKCPRGSS